MEFDKPSTKYLFIGTSLIIVMVFVALGAMIHKMETAQTARHLQNRQDCIKLDARYGYTYQVKDGPYRAIDMLAIDFSGESVTLIAKYGQDSTKRYFLCQDLVEVKEGK